MRYIRDLALLTADLCAVAVQQSCKAFRLIPTPLRIAELCHMACSRDGNCLPFVPKPLLTDVLCLVAVQQNGLSMRFVPKQYQTHDVCMAAIDQNRRAIEYIKQPIRAHWAYFHSMAPLAVPVFQPQPQIRIQPLPPHVANVCIQRAIVAGDVCGIMQEPLEAASAVVTSCGHVFTREAVQTWLTLRNTCPTCVQPCVI